MKKTNKLMAGLVLGAVMVTGASAQSSWYIGGGAILKGSAVRTFEFSNGKKVDLDEDRSSGYYAVIGRKKGAVRFEYEIYKTGIEKNSVKEEERSFYNINMAFELGFLKFWRFTPYVKIGAGYVDNPDLDKSGYSINGGVGMYVNVIKHVELDVKYDYKYIAYGFDYYNVYDKLKGLNVGVNFHF